MAAQNATVTNMRAAIVSMQHKGRHEVLPAVYALLWRPRDWRVYSCPHPVTAGRGERGKACSSITKIV